MALPGVRRGLVDPEVVVRIAAARAAWMIGAGAQIEAELVGLLDSPTWTLRWYGAAALAGTAQRERATAVLVASFPERADARGISLRIHVTQ